MNASGPGRNLLRDVSRSFYLSLRLLPPGMRPACSTGYLLARLSDTIADTASLPVQERLQLLCDFRTCLLGDLPFSRLGESLFQTLRPHLTHPGEIRLVDATATCFRQLAALEPRQAHAVSEVVRIITAGQESDLAHFPGARPESAPSPLSCLPAASQLLTYTDQVAGCVGRFWSRVGFLSDPRFSSLAPGKLEELGTRFGQGLQLVNILRDLPEDLEAGRCYLPLDELLQHGWHPEIPWRSQLEPLRQTAAAWEDRAWAGLEDGLRYAGSLRSRRVRLATALPASIGLRTLTLLREAPEQRFHSKLKIKRSELRQSLTTTGVSAFFGLPFPLPSPR